MIVANKTKPMTTMCCECGRMRLGSVWVEGRVPTETDVFVSHGFCPRCYEAELLAAITKTVMLAST